MFFQALECKAGGAAEFGEKRADVLGSLDGLIDLLGELSLAVRVEDKLFGNGKGSGLHHPVRTSILHSLLLVNDYYSHCPLLHN